MADPALGIVVIGRNEGARLVRCLASVAEGDWPVVYVDSGSTDDSVEAAERAGAQVIELDLAVPFTAARARNAGVEALLAGGALDYVQFIDGDCEMRAGWIEAGIAALEADPALGVVAGRLRERHPEASVYNRLCDMEWNTPVGPASGVGGIAIYRMHAFQELGGFDKSLICGEEPELCLRLRRAGWSVHRLDAEMALHDAAMTRFGQYAKRSVRSGWAYAEGADRYGKGPEKYNTREHARIWLWAAIVPGAILALLTLWLLTSSGWFLILALIGLAAYPLMILKIARYRRVAFGDPWSHALIYGLFIKLARPWQLRGVLQYRAHKARGGLAEIIEYKTTESQAGGSS